MSDRLKAALLPLLKFGFFPLMRIKRGLTLGVRGVVFDDEGRVLLVRHSYAPGWTFPGGGVERGEPAEMALARELQEEAGIIVAGRPQLHGIFANFAALAGDHVIVYVVRSWDMPNGPATGLEIVEQGFFAPGALPDTTSAGARRRLAEIDRGGPVSASW